MKKITLVLAAFLVAANVVKAQDDRDFSGTKWVLESVDGEVLAEQKALTKKAFVKFNEDELSVSGYSGCNSFGASFYLSGDILKFDNVVSTMRACPEGPSKVESALFSVFSRCDACLIIGDKLSLMSLGKEIATFVAEDENQSIAVEQPDTTKQAVYYHLVEEKPKYQCGDLESFKQWVEEQFKETKNIDEKDKIRRMVVRFIVDENGKLTDAKIVQGITPLIDSEVLKIMNNSLEWLPGKQNGKNVAVDCTVSLKLF